MTVNGSMESSTGMECGRGPVEIAISDSGYRTKLMGMGSTSGGMVIGMKVNGSTVFVTDRAQTLLQTEMSIWASTTTAKPTVMDNTVGLTATLTQASL